MTVSIASANKLATVQSTALKEVFKLYSTSHPAHIGEVFRKTAFLYLENQVI